MVFQVNAGPTGFVSQCSKFLANRSKNYVDTGDPEVIDSKQFS